MATLWVDGASVWLPGLLLLGGVVGYIAGLFGVGGGFLLTPMLVVVFRVSPAVAVGSGLCQMVGTSLVTLLRHRRAGQGELRVDLLLLGGSLLGVDAGARSLDALSRAGSVDLAGRAIPLVRLVAEGLFSVVLLAVAALFWWQGRSAAAADDAPAPGPLARLRLPPLIDLPTAGLRSVSAPLLSYLGLLLGFLSGLLGIGGGVLLLPVLIYGLGFSIRAAASTGVAMLFVSACLGTFLHALRGHVHLGLVVPLLVASSLSAQLGARSAHRLPARSLRRGFSLVALAAAAALLWHLAR